MGSSPSAVPTPFSRPPLLPALLAGQRREDVVEFVVPPQFHLQVYHPAAEYGHAQQSDLASRLEADALSLDSTKGNGDPIAAITMSSAQFHGLQIRPKAIAPPKASGPKRSLRIAWARTVNHSWLCAPVIR
jgi:hypothetical protein